MINTSELKQLFNLLPGVAVQAVNLPQLIASATAVALKAASSSDYKRNKEILSSVCGKDLILCDVLPHHNDLDQQGAERLLTLYFDQFTIGAQTHIDFRKQYFSQIDSTLFWCPSKIRYQFTEPFKAGIRDLYQGFYNNQQEQLVAGLASLELLKVDSSRKYKEQLVKIFFQHFGQAQSGKVKLSLEHFRSSFSRIFEFFSENRVAVPIDFAFLGIYLVTMYQHLDSIPHELDVAHSFRLSALSRP
jgi:hypothetical protein